MALFAAIESSQEPYQPRLWCIQLNVGTCPRPTWVMPLKLTICLAYLSANYKTSSGVDEALHRMDLKVDQMDPNTNWWPSSTAANGAFFFAPAQFVSVSLCKFLVASWPYPCRLTLCTFICALSFQYFLWTEAALKIQGSEPGSWIEIWSFIPHMYKT